MNGVAYLAWRYLTHHKYKTAILVLAITLILYVPAGLRALVRLSERQLTSRAAATPLLIGAKGSPLELVLNSLYARAEVPAPLTYAAVDEVTATGLARAIPLYVRFHAQQDPIVGTTLDYFEFRGLRVAAGRQMARLGDCVLGASAARRRGTAPGGWVISSPENAFDLAGVYPLKMRVTGVLAYSDSPDDDAIFTDVKTTWLIEGLAHGHQDLTKPEAAPGVLKREGGAITANASVTQYNEVTDENIRSFHFHGDAATFPITAIIAAPRDTKSATLLMGRYQAADRPQQIVQPLEVIRELMSAVFAVQSFVLTALIVTGVATLATAGLVFLLSLRLRRREIATLVKIGGSRARVAAVVVSEVAAVVGASAMLAAALTWITGSFGSEIIRNLVAR
ncbi:MAG: ABC transporter permease [Bryobacteraceae bacterium]|nr:ABC transporter permease [Bryobacteraceae bacterium]